MMQTCCPACATAFRVIPEQLKMRQGQVRCGKCQQVFDALAALREEPAVPIVPAVPPMAPAEQAAAGSEPMAAFDAGVDVNDNDSPIPAASSEVAISENGFESGSAESAPTEPIEPIEPTDFAESAEPAASAAPAGPVDATEAAARASEPDAAEERPDAAMVDMASEIVAPVAESAAEPEPAAAATVAAQSEPEPESEPESGATASAEPRRVPSLHDEGEALAASPWPWLLASLLAMLLLSFQLLIHFRSEALVLAPELKPALQAVCDALGCDLSLPRQPDRLSIEASDLHPDAQRQELLTLTATLKNRAPFAQQLPHLELTLTDAYDQPLLRKAIAPDEYLPQEGDHAPRRAGFAPRDELAIHLSLLPENSVRASAVGYRLYLFYP